MSSPSPGDPGLGKTWLMLWSAFSMWMQGLPVLFISMEIKPTPILQRISAIHARIAPSHLKVGLMTTEEKKDYQKVLSSNCPACRTRFGWWTAT